MTDKTLRVALIGLGDIAEKAYLPVLLTDPLVEAVLITRDAERRRELQAAWRVPEAYPTVEDALAAGCRLDAAFVHAATEAHLPIALTLIDAGIPTFIDKPLALNAVDAREVVERARAAQVSLAVCFNRRFAPAYSAMAAWPGLDTAVLTKNRIGLPGDPRTVVFDDYIHVVDTLRFLVAPDPERLEVSARPGPDGTLARIAITVHQQGRLGVGIMDRDSGQTVEVLQATAPGRSGQIVDLVDVVERHDSAAHRRQPDNWASVAQQRGFVAMVDHLLASVRAGEILDAGDALATHELCERILTELQEQLPG